MANTPRKLPHKSIDPKFGLEVLYMDMDALKKNDKTVINPEIDGEVIVNHFESLTRKIFREAIARFFFEGISPDQFLEMMKKSSLAASNYFRLITNTNKEREISYQWEGKDMLIKHVEERIQHTADCTLNMGLTAAILSNQTQDIEYLSNIDLSNLGPNMYPHAFILRTLALQAICNDNKKQLGKYLEAIEKLPSPNRNLDAKLIDSECKSLFALGKGDFDQLIKCMEDNLRKHKKMYDNDSRNMRYNYFGFISVFNIAVLIMANKRGATINLKNQYMPEELLKASLKAFNNV